MLINNKINIINVSDFTEEQLKHFEESHRKWVESTRNIPIQSHYEKYYEENTSPKFFNKDRFVILSE